jgi:hypothetical protein
VAEEGKDFTIRAVPVRLPNPLKNFLAWTTSGIQSGSRGIGPLHVGDTGPRLDEGESPFVIIENRFGVYRRLIETDTFNEAQRETKRIQQDIQREGFDILRARYGLPEDFLTRRNPSVVLLLQKIGRATLNRFRQRTAR